MFETIVNFLSPAAALNESTSPQQAAAAVSKMARRTRTSLASIPNALADSDLLPQHPITTTTSLLPTPSTADHEKEDPMEVEVDVNFSVALLTPENSRSETSSNNDNASSEEKVPSRRTSTRLTRASLRGGDKIGQITQKTVIQTNSDVEMPDAAVNDHGAGRYATPVSKEDLSSAPSSNEATELAADRRRSLRERPQKVSVAEEQQHTEKKKKKETGPTTESPNKTPAKSEETNQPSRRSSRLSLIAKTTTSVEKVNSVLGKRSRDAMEKRLALSRRASLRPRHSLPAKPEATNAAPQTPDAKKRRVSDGALLAKPTGKDNSTTTTEEPAKPVPVPRFRPKRWLSSGLYTGQDRNMDPRLNEAKNKIKSAKRNAPVEPQRRFLPLPMFAGERLLKHGRDFKLPYHIFSPLPPGQPKPDEWRKVNKNVFVGDAASFWRAKKNVELSTCMCTEDTGCDENCQNRYMFYECDNSNCRLGEGCGNRNFEELKHRTKAGGKYNIGVEVIKTADRGYGVRSNRTFEANQIIVEYTGEIITQGECERRMRTIYKNNECYYLMYFDQNMIIDATRGSIARFVNHSCEPNCRMEKWTVAGKPRMALFAGDKGIMTGEELTYDYNFDPFSQKNVQVCKCGSTACRGVLGPRPKEREQRATKEPKPASPKKNQSPVKKGSKTAVAGIKRKIGATMASPASRMSKKRKILAPTKPLKTGIKKAVSKARVSVSGKKGTTTVVAKTTKTTKTTVTKKVPSKAKVKVRMDPKTKTAITKAKDKPAAKKPASAVKSTAKRPTAPKAVVKSKSPIRSKSSASRKPSTKGKASASVRGKPAPAKPTPKTASQTKAKTTAATKAKPTPVKRKVPNKAKIQVAKPLLQKSNSESVKGTTEASSSSSSKKSKESLPRSQPIKAKPKLKATARHSTNITPLKRNVLGPKSSGVAKRTPVKPPPRRHLDLVVSGHE